MKTSKAMIEKIKIWEGVRTKRYKDSVGLWTIGVGHLITEQDNYKEPLSMRDVDQLLQADLKRFENEVKILSTVAMSQCEFDALVSFSFNLGTAKLAKSTLLKLHNAGDKEGAAAQFVRWSNAGGKFSEPLMRRRIAERDRYLERW